VIRLGGGAHGLAVLEKLCLEGVKVPLVCFRGWRVAIGGRKPAAAFAIHLILSTTF
jgi:hypothetical protein